MEKSEVVQILNDIGTILEINGENFFKAKAYYDAARKIELLEDDLKILIQEDRLKDIKGFGKALTSKLSELILTGRLEYYEKLKNSIPDGLIQILKIPGMGPKKVGSVYKKLGITTIGELEYACKENRLSKLEGFGEKSQKKILDSIINMKNYKGFMLYSQALDIAEKIKIDIIDNCQVEYIDIAGSLRRKKEVVKDIDILASFGSSNLIDYFVDHEYVDEVVSKGNTKVSVMLKQGIGADLRIVTTEEYPYALHHFTGSREHNTAMRSKAKNLNLKMNEYGIFKNDILIECKNEKDIFDVFEMDFIEPELRENNGELQAAEEKNLPSLVKPEDIRGLFHVHSTYSDAAMSLEQLAHECIRSGYEYVVICDHSISAYYANGLNTDDIKRQHDEIDKLNEKWDDFKLFKGIETDILPDGSIDYEEDVLVKFDFVIASVHSSFNMTAEQMTQRIINALSNKYVSALGHPTGRLLLAREPYKLDLDEIFNFSIKTGKLIEINADPLRMDLDWRFVKKAKDMGISFVISPDAHSIEGLANVNYGVNIARKGWLEKSDILNTKNLNEFEKYIKSRR